MLIPFISRTLSPGEKRYSMLDKETPINIYVVKHFQQYVYGRSFVIIS